MRVYNYSSRNILEADFQDKNLEDACIMNSDADGINLSRMNWEKVSVSFTNCNDAVFSGMNLRNCSFSKSNLSRSAFTGCRLSGTTFSGLSLIKIQLKNSKFENLILDSCTLQRAQFTKSIFINSSFKDFEGLITHLSDCIFINCRFNISYGSGMNGFSSGIIENCLFYGCSFEGFPLRGAESRNSTFISCTGEITDDINSENSYGLPFTPVISGTELKNREQALKLLNNTSGAKYA